MPFDAKKKLIDLSALRTAALDRANAAMEAENHADFESAMNEVTNLNTEMEGVKKLYDEQQRRAIENVPTGAEARDIANERGNTLRNKGTVTFDSIEVQRMLARNAVTLSTTAIAEPTGVDANIRDPLGNGVSSILDQVYVEDLTGMGAYEVPYVISELDAVGGDIKTKSGTARTASTDPVFGVAQIKPYEATVTAYVDRNIAKLTPARYYEKIYNMAMRAMRRKVAELIVNGDGQTTPAMYGIKTAKNKAGALIYASEAITAIDEELLDNLFYAYGSDSEMGAGARLYLTKPDLKTIGKLRNSDKDKIFKVRSDPANPNTGTIEDGGNIIPYCIVPSLTSLSTATQGAAAIQTMLYGDPMNYMLGLFGGYEIRVDDSIKGVERMTTILGDVAVGGNLTVDKGMVVATVPAKG